MLGPLRHGPRALSTRRAPLIHLLGQVWSESPSLRKATGRMLVLSPHGAPTRDAGRGQAGALWAALLREQAAAAAWDGPAQQPALKGSGEDGGLCSALFSRHGVS